MGKTQRIYDLALGRARDRTEHDVVIFDPTLELVRPVTQDDIDMLVKIAEAYGALRTVLRKVVPTPDGWAPTLDKHLALMRRLARV
jgi:hypothetical protein